MSLNNKRENYQSKILRGRHEDTNHIVIVATALVASAATAAASTAIVVSTPSAWGKVSKLYLLILFNNAEYCYFNISLHTNAMEKSYIITSTNAEKTKMQKETNLKPHLATS